MSTPTRPQTQKPQKPKSAAQRASEANTLQQRAVFANSARPGDRKSPQPTRDPAKAVTAPADESGS